MKQTGVCGPLARRGADNAISTLWDAERAALQVIIERSPRKTHREYCLMLAIACGPHAWISTDTLAKEIARLGFAPVVPEFVARQRFSERVQQHTLWYLIALQGKKGFSLITNEWMTIFLYII